MRKPCLVLTGPTAVGKTRLSLALAHRIRGSVISADSMQVYRGMDIGSAKILPEEMEGIPHYLVDVLEPEEEFHVARFQQMAKEAMEEIWARGRIPVLTGGTGFYIQALLKNVDFSDSSGASSLRPELEKLGEEALYQRLLEKDPEAAEAIHPHNRKRVIRALEYCLETGRKISDHNQRERQRPSPYCCGYFVLNDEREKLYRQIDRRVDLMIEKGLVEEVRRLAARGLTEENTSMKGLGYKELFPYLRGEMELDETLTSREVINTKMRSALDVATDPWGIKVNRVELKNIMPPKAIQEAMEKQMKAERERREAILIAEGEKKSTILIAEGKKESAILDAEAEKQSAILKAEAEKERRIREAEGQAEAILKVQQANADGIRFLKEAGADESVLTLKSLEALGVLANGRATKIVVPSDIQGLASLATSLKAIVEDKIEA